MKSLVHAILTSYAASSQIIDVSDPLSDSSCGGGRAAFLGLLKELPKYGHEVRAFSTFKEKVYKDGVTYIPIDQHEAILLPLFHCPMEIKHLNLISNNSKESVVLTTFQCGNHSLLKEPGILYRNFYFNCLSREIIHHH